MADADDGCHTDTPAGAEPVADETPAEETTAEETPAEEPPAAEPFVAPLAEEPQPDGQLADETPAEETTAEETTAEETPAEEPPAAEPFVAPLAEEPQPDGQLADVLAGLTSLGVRVDELARLRTRDTDLIARLHDDVTKLRTGEISAALNPVVNGMIKLHDQMVSLGALNDPDSPVGMLHTQLLQILELTCAVKPFTPAAGERFDASRHTGARRIPTTDRAADGTIAGTIKPGFARADGSIVRVADVEVHRLSG